NRYGYFPAASVGLVMSIESFLTVPRSAVTSVKLRGSYGKLGNQEIADYQYQGTINTGGLQTLVSSPNIKWEEKTITNIGFDGTFLDSHLDFSAEYYISRSDDIL